jgi:anti-anti-sigma factor
LLNYKDEGEFAVFYLSGMMSFPKGTEYLKEQVLIAMKDKKNFVLELSAVSYFDSFSAGELLNIHSLLKNTGGTLCLCNPNGLVKDFFDSLCISRIIKIYDNIKEALLSRA